MKCELDAEGHCITCSDEALPARVLRIDQDTGVAFVTIEEATEEVDITLIDDVAPGDMILVHGGVAIAITETNPYRVGAGLAPALATNSPLVPALATKGPLAPALATSDTGEANDA